VKCLHSRSNCSCQTTAMETSQSHSSVHCTPHAYDRVYSLRLQLIQYTVERFQAYNACLTLAVIKPLRVATDWLDGDTFTRLIKTLRFHVRITVNRQEFRVMTYLSLHLIANKVLELVYENAPESTILKIKKIQFICREGLLTPSHSAPRFSRLRGSTPHCLFLSNQTLL